MPPRPARESRREKAKSSQSFAQYSHDAARQQSRRQQQQQHDVRIPTGTAATTAAGRANDLEAREASGQDASDTQRPRLQYRTNSAPGVELHAAFESHTPAVPALTMSDNVNAFLQADGQDEDEVAGVVGAVRHFTPFQNPQLSEPLPELNIVVIGAEGVGKSVFIQNALQLPGLPLSQAAESKFPVGDSDYLVRLLEIPLEDIEVEDETICFPDIIENKMMPKVDGAVALYDVQDKSSVAELPEMLNAIAKASIPAVLIASKCDTPPAERELNPDRVSENAKRQIGNINTLQVSQFTTEANKRGVFILLNDIVRSNSERRARSASARRRAQSSAARPVSPRMLGHSRASSEYTGSLRKEVRHSRHDSSIAGGDRLRVPREDDQMQSSFLLEESASEQSRASSSSSIHADLSLMAGANPTSTSLSEHGATFGELVDRLLAQPASKSDLKFAAIFLALYRNFAPPGLLLDSIIERFDALERASVPQILKTQTQLRYIGIIEQWCGWYPGDFAHARTRRHLRTFVSKLAEARIFAQAAREINVDLDSVKEDDDTIWACCDKDSPLVHDRSASSISSTASTLHDPLDFTFDHALSGDTLSNTSLNDYLPKFANQMIANVEQSQRQANLLRSIPRNPVAKTQWRLLMEQPDEAIAMELTRMDWIMFSAIRPRDLVRHVSSTKEQKKKYNNLAHVDRMIEHFNQLANWVANYVLLRDKPKHRALMLEKFMRIARKLRELNNYNSLGAIIAGVKSTSVHRLAATRELLPPAAGKDWMKLEILMAPSRSHFAYRLAWENSSSERIPYLPLHRRDLATAEEGNKTFLGGEDDPERINWKKFEIMGDVIISIQRAQGLPYKNLGGTKGNEQIRELVLDVKLIKDEEELYERSVQCEPPANVPQTSTTSKFRDFFKR